MRTLLCVVLATLVMYLPTYANAQVVVNAPAQMPSASSRLESFTTYAQCLANGGQAFPVGAPVYDNGSYKFYQMRCVIPQTVGCIPSSIVDKLDSYPSGDTVNVCNPAVDECCGIGGDDGVMPLGCCRPCSPPICATPVYSSPSCCQYPQPNCCNTTVVHSTPANSCGTLLPTVSMQAMPMTAAPMAAAPMQCGGVSMAAAMPAASATTSNYCPIAYYGRFGGSDYWVAVRCRVVGLCIAEFSNYLLQYPAGTPVIPGCNPFDNCRCFTSGGTLIEF